VLVNKNSIVSQGKYLSPSSSCLFRNIDLYFITAITLEIAFTIELCTNVLSVVGK